MPIKYTDFVLCVLLDDADVSSFRFSGFFDISCPALKSSSETKVISGAWLLI